ncbi:unnamed protein product, partial [Brenthis ino]
MCCDLCRVISYWIIVYNFCFDSSHCKLSIKRRLHTPPLSVCSMSIPGMRAGCVVLAQWLRDRSPCASSAVRSAGK